MFAGCVIVVGWLSVLAFGCLAGWLVGLLAGGWLAGGWLLVGWVVSRLCECVVGSAGGCVIVSFGSGWAWLILVV